MVEKLFATRFGRQREAISLSSWLLNRKMRWRESRTGLSRLFRTATLVRRYALGCYERHAVGQGRLSPRTKRSASYLFVHWDFLIQTRKKDSIGSRVLPLLFSTCRWQQSA